MAKNSRAEQLQWGGYVQVPVAEEDVEHIDKMIAACKGNPTAALAAMISADWKVALTNPDQSWKVVISNTGDRFGDGKSYYVSAEGNTLVEAVMCMAWKLAKWTELGCPLPAEPARGRFR